MKYENFKQAKGLVEQIDKHIETLKKMGGSVDVVLNSIDYGSRLYTIGTENDCEHEYTDQAGVLVDYIKSDLTSRIDNLKEMLELL